MIKLHLAIYEGDRETLYFETKDDLVEYLKELKSFDCIWLVTDDGEYGEIIITENVFRLVDAVSNDHFNLLDNDLHVQEYQSYKDAYEVALDMREENPKCF